MELPSSSCKADLASGTAGNQVSFTTTAGTFADGKTTISATVDGQVMLCPVTCAFRSNNKSCYRYDRAAVLVDSARFDRAYPEHVAVETKDFAVGASPTKETVITVHLRRSDGNHHGRPPGGP
jgi:hypothetical protein